MKPERLHLPTGMIIETRRDHNGRSFIGYRKNCSMYFTCKKELLKFLKVPKGTPSRESLDSWLASLEAADTERQLRKQEGLSAEILATGFGPECHDEDDPTANTKMII